MSPSLNPQLFQRQDETPDHLFYQEPRLVTHIDDDAIAAATALYDEVLPESGDILDLMSSWKSHLPAHRAFRSVTGLGMNAKELEANEQLTAAVVHDLNRNPALPFADEQFDGCVVTVSVQYLTQPIAVFREVNRVLKPDAPFVLTFSNRCFPTKAVALWRGTSDVEHMQVVAAYFNASGGWGEIYAQDRSPRKRGYTDPLYGVWAWKRRPGPIERPGE